jgi:hypothetical protein
MEEASKSRPILALLPAAAVTALALAGGAVAGYAPPPTGQMAVVFPPWLSEQSALALVLGAGGDIVGPTHFGNIVVAYAHDIGFSARVRAAGAWLTMAGTSFLCSPDPVVPPGI